MATVTLKGNPVTVAGNLPKKGELRRRAFSIEMMR